MVSPFQIFTSKKLDLLTVVATVIEFERKRALADLADHFRIFIRVLLAEVLLGLLLDLFTTIRHRPRARLRDSLRRDGGLFPDLLFPPPRVARLLVGQFRPLSALRVSQNAFLLGLRESRKPLCSFKAIVVRKSELFRNLLFVALLLGFLRYFVAEVDRLEPRPTLVEWKPFGNEVPGGSRRPNKYAVALGNPFSRSQVMHELRIRMMRSAPRVLLVRCLQIVGRLWQGSHRSPDQLRDRQRSVCQNLF